MVMEGRRKLGAKADAALGGDSLSDRGLWSCSVDSGDVPKSMVKEYLEKIDRSFVCQTWRRHLSAEARESGRRRTSHPRNYRFFEISARGCEFLGFGMGEARDTARMLSGISKEWCASGRQRCFEPRRNMGNYDYSSSSIGCGMSNERLKMKIRSCKFDLSTITIICTLHALHSLHLSSCDLAFGQGGEVAGPIMW